MYNYNPYQGQYQGYQYEQKASPIIWVQGEQSARAYMVAPGSSVLLMDSESSTFYLKSTDASGMPQPMRVFDYTERTEKPSMEYVTREEFNALLEQLTKGGDEK